MVLEYAVTLSNRGGSFTITDIWLGEEEGGADRAIEEAIYLARDSLNMTGEIKYVSHTGS